MHHFKKKIPGPYRILAIALWVGTSTTVGCSCFMEDKLGLGNGDHATERGDQFEEEGQDEGITSPENPTADPAGENEPEPDPQGTEQDGSQDKKTGKPQPERTTDAEQKAKEEATNAEPTPEAEDGESSSGSSEGNPNLTDPEQAAQAAAALLEQAKSLARQGEQGAAYKKAIEALNLVYPHAKEDEKCDELRRQATNLTEELDAQHNNTAPSENDPVRLK